MKTPYSADLELAAEWLEQYEGVDQELDDDEVAACKRVADWLREKAAQADLRDICKDSGVSVAQARKALKAAKQEPALLRSRRVTL